MSCNPFLSHPVRRQVQNTFSSYTISLDLLARIESEGNGVNVPEAIQSTRWAHNFFGLYSLVVGSSPLAKLVAKAMVTPQSYPLLWRWQELTMYVIFSSGVHRDSKCSSGYGRSSMGCWGALSYTRTCLGWVKPLTTHFQWHIPQWFEPQWIIYSHWSPAREGIQMTPGPNVEQCNPPIVGGSLLRITRAKWMSPVLR